MEIRDILRVKNIVVAVGSNVVRIPPETTIAAAASRLAEEQIGLVVVSDETSHLRGVISERDVVRAVGTAGEGALAQEVAQFMTKNVKTCGPADHPYDVMKLMAAGGFRHIPVVEDGELLALISTRDILVYLTRHAPPESQALFLTKISWL